MLMRDVTVEVCISLPEVDDAGESNFTEDHGIVDIVDEKILAEALARHLVEYGTGCITEFIEFSDTYDSDS